MARILINRRTGPIPIRKSEMQTDPVWICGCGLTRTPPYCDSSHAAARKEPPGSLVFYLDNDARNAPVPVDPTPLLHDVRDVDAKSSDTNPEAS